MVFLRALFIPLIICLFATPGKPQRLVLEFIGETEIETGKRFNDTEVGGLSGLTYDAGNELYYAVSDDYGKNGPARFYSFKIALTHGRLTDASLSFQNVHFLTDENKKRFEPGSVDLEGIALVERVLFCSSEGAQDTKYPPFIRSFTLDGEQVRDLPLPPKFLPSQNRDFGVANNRALESLAATPDGKFLFCANEEALSQDGPAARPDRPSPVRIIKYELTRYMPVTEYLYWVEPLPEAPISADGSPACGLVDFEVLSDSKLITLERSYVPGRGNGIRLFTTSLNGADNIAGIERLDNVETDNITPAQKRLLFDFDRLGIKLDNIEALTFGPKLSDGRRRLILASDNNFNPNQVTQFIAFAVAFTNETFAGLEISEIQGRGHQSPFMDCKVEEIEGIVTNVNEARNFRGFWMQSEKPDAEIATAEGIFVEVPSTVKLPVPGDKVSVAGKVNEQGRRDGTELTRTQITSRIVTVVSSDNSLPEATIIGESGRMPPVQIIEDDNFTRFEPLTDGADFYESMEGMRVALNEPVVVGHRTRFGECPVLPDQGLHAVLRTSRGGILLREHDFNPEIISIRGKKGITVPEAQVGAHFVGVVNGVLDYSFGNYKVMLTEILPPLFRRTPPREKTKIRGDTDWLSVANYNVENLDFNDKASKFKRLAESIVSNLGAPDIIALQEVQDDTGPNDDGTVTAEKTLDNLIAAVRVAGGPAYEFCQVSPADNMDGGQPGGNIRVAFLYNANRVSFERRGKASAQDNAALGEDGRLILNPVRIVPSNNAFERSRKPLVGEFSFNGHRILLINCHLNSKRGDSSVWGTTQPPIFRSEKQRNLQAEVIEGFVDKVFTSDPHANVLALGDMNEHEFRQPMKILAGEHLVDMIPFVPEPERYTYIYAGNSQVLDHIFASKHLVSEGSFDIDIVHMNAEFEHRRQASDHDPIVARFKLNNRVVESQ